MKKILTSLIIVFSLLALLFIGMIAGMILSYNAIEEPVENYPLYQCIWSYSYEYNFPQDSESIEWIEKQCILLVYLPNSSIPIVEDVQEYESETEEEITITIMPEYKSPDIEPPKIEPTPSIEEYLN